MRKPWSISTTVRNPERLRDFLKVLKQLEGESFTKENQVKYQILLIKERLYKPNNIPPKYQRYYEEPTLEIPYNVAEKIFEYQNYEDPPMRGRQSVNPLNKLGFAIAREGYGPIKITDLGNLFLEGDYDIGFVFLKSLLKLQFPNPWSRDFSAKHGFNITPFIATLRLIYELNQRSKIKGLSKEEFCLFIPTLTDANRINDQIENILAFRKLRNNEEKQEYIWNFAREFYGSEKITKTKINNLSDYGDNTIRYFRLTRFFRIHMNPLGHHWRIDLEPSRMTEIEQLLGQYDGKAFEFKTVEEYLEYISDITRPQLPWEHIDNLKKVAVNLRNIIVDLVKREGIKLEQNDQRLVEIDMSKFNKKDILEKHIRELRGLNLRLKLSIKKKKLVGNIEKIKEIISILDNPRLLRKLDPEGFEKILTEALKILNDEILIKPNYPVDDEGEPINHAPGNKPDIECYYRTFKAICEVTLNTSNLQWVQEGQPVMRHLRNFEREHGFENIYCIFVAPRIHKDTYSQFWISVKYEYDGKPQKIIPLTTQHFALLLKKLLQYIETGKKFSHYELHKLYEKIINETKKVNSFSDWTRKIDQLLECWMEERI
ncbi:AlwI family type II restriction endonuclease [Kosmotoga sp. DU53]|uniref:AlwI family type II restriction endonuclease n=1 Tax=Kosmotoga sp. DU53 TaxID=1310160 RepID=UPI0007C5B7F8|nr:AlwI family type II restriction endonuclease [Kosmotoga sp. DU53]OAA25084.1 hypothetical protein DU53_00420 [Kosmotoga sp. DU53]